MATDARKFVTVKVGTATQLKGVCASLATLDITASQVIYNL